MNRLVLLFALSAAGPGSVQAGPPLTAQQRDFMGWGFGMFVHFHLATSVDNDWAGGYEDPGRFAPRRLDCGEWADAAKAAGMTYLVLTVKHTEGIALYPSAVTGRDTRLFRNFRGGRADIVADFMAACRSRGLKAGLYYCMPGDYSDAAHHNAPPPGQPNLHGMPPEAAGDYAGFAERQLAEMLTRYHPDLLWVDQYANPYTGSRWPEILAAIRRAAPGCIVVANNARELGPTDVLSYEFPWKGDLPPVGNGEPAEVCDTIQTGARWFWRKSDRPGDLRPAAEIVRRLRECRARHANYLLDVPPDPEGLISGPQLARLREVAALLAPAAAGRAAPTPAILVTDIGSDIDDAWALALALRSPELALKLVVTDPADTVYRARLTAKLLEAAGRTDVAVGVGDNSGPQGDNSKTQIDWVGQYDLKRYPGRVYADGVSALIDVVEHSPEPVTVIAIGPAHSLALAVKRDPHLAARCRLVGMFGSFDRGYPGGPPLPEFNVRVDLPGFRTVMAAPWRDILLTPLDTCGLVRLSGPRYHAIWSATDDPLLRALIECYCCFVPRAQGKSVDGFSVRSSTLFDTVAVYLAYSQDLVEVEDTRFDVAADGLTFRSPQGPFHARLALRWKNEDGFEAQLAGRLLGPALRPSASPPGPASPGN